MTATDTRISVLLEGSADVLSELVTDEELVDADYCQAQLRTIARILRSLSATIGARERPVPPDEESEWVDSWYDHVGALPRAMAFLPTGVRRRFYDARLIWAHELDTMTDADLLALPGVGPKSVSALRHALDVYYWRGEQAESVEMWTGILEDLERARTYRYQRRPDRVAAGLEFAQRVLDTAGDALADPLAARLAVP